jgi:hypothetical protein
MAVAQHGQAGDALCDREQRPSGLLGPTNGSGSSSSSSINSKSKNNSSIRSN